MAKTNGQLSRGDQRRGSRLRKSATAPFLLVGVYSPHGNRDAAVVYYAYIHLNDPIGRSYGVGPVKGLRATSQYAMRLG